MAARTPCVRAVGALVLSLSLLLAACPDDATVADGDADAVDTAAPIDSAGGDAVGDDTSAPDVGDTASPQPPAHCFPGSAVTLGNGVGHYRIVEGGETGTTVVVGCEPLELRVTLSGDGVVRIVRQSGASEARGWALAEPPQQPEVQWVGEYDDGLAICTPELAITLTDGCGVVVRDAAGTTLMDMTGVEEQGGDLVARYATPAGERFYGFGEHQGAFDRRGTTMVHWNTDAYDSAYGGYAPDTDPLYLGVPFFVGLREGTAYGVLFDDSHRLTFDMADSASTAWTLRTPADRVDQYVIAGSAIADVVRRYTDLTGRTSLPPRWSLGFHQSRWGYSPDTAFAAIGAELRDRDLPADGLWLDIQHMDGFRTFSWDPATFSDPGGLLAGLEADGFKTIVISDPGIKLDPGWGVYDRGLAADAWLKKPDGSAFVGKVWPGDSVFPDFTLPAARAWWAAEVKTNALRGLRGVWLDVNEPTVFPESGGGQSVDDDVVAAGDGTPTTMAEVHNVYALYEARATFEGLLAAFPDRRPFILSRAGFAGIQRYAAIWTGDAPSSWTSLQHTLPMLLNLGMSGVPFVGSDVGGYSGGATPELYARWMALGSVSPFFRAHVTSGVAGQEPWAFGQEVTDISRIHIERRYALLPYLYSLFDEAARTGAPVLRPLVWHFQGDAKAQTVGDEAMLGPYLLVAPVVTEGATSRQVYLPEGRWFERFSGAAYEGPTTVTATLRLQALPTYVRAGAIVPTQEAAQTADAPPAGRLTLDVYPVVGEATAFTLYEDAGDGFGAATRTTYTLAGDAGGASLSATRTGDFTAPSRVLVVRFQRVDHAPTAVTLDGAALTAAADVDAVLASGAGWAWDQADLALVVAFDDHAGFALDARYDPTITLPGPDVAVPLRVKLPAGTPTDVVVHVASDADGWAFHALDRASETLATGTVLVPRGQWFDYKYSWGDWCTVEKWPGCVEADNRYAFGAAHPVKEDQVFEWRGWCDPCP
ncbi:MAG: alpha-glucosidase [Deltaproteobacteria bacterium]|nr:MAG: alpha-glucosidase [Deltaproteobacteria bacterium]